MTWTTMDDLDAFLAVADDYLSARPDRHTMLLSAIASHRSADHRYAAECAPLYGWWREASGERRLAGAFVWTPPHLIAISPMPGEATSRLAPVIAAQRRATTGLVGPGPAVHEIVGAWFRHTGSRAYVRRNTRLYRLGRLTWPKPPVPGRSRPATAGDRGLLLEWCEAFARETGERLADGAALVDERLAYGGWTLWESADGPVSLAGITRATSRMARITPV
ncbi:hypothetical protein FB559_6402 [Actinoallomurus bryophytorum]|uniref:Uncharacterized protein n=1 Tax=Actinoallomurus bryophytorum TaxID=1490222 RepID=A0A543CU94_9ACTN|nr:GNAT family N-acetyltransferase [Actinoallomurus bryophytorum]TQM00685.1 hypothetical protein FB559_6402 [Actinoallomurus bryophytorum]